MDMLCWSQAIPKPPCPILNRVLRDLGGAYAQLGNAGMASLLTAERYALLGRPKDATIHAKRAFDLLKRGSPGWQRAQDVLFASESAINSRRKK